MRKACLECPNRQTCPLLSKNAREDPGCHPEKDVILVPNQPNTIQIEWHSGKQGTPEEEIERTVKILRNFKGLPEPTSKIVIGNLYVGDHEKEKHRLAYAFRQAENIERGLTMTGGTSGVGSLYGKANPHRMVQPGDNRITEEARRELAESTCAKRRFHLEAETRAIENRG